MKRHYDVCSVKNVPYSVTYFCNLGSSVLQRNLRQHGLPAQKCINHRNIEIVGLSESNLSRFLL